MNRHIQSVTLVVAVTERYVCCDGNSRSWNKKTGELMPGGSAALTVAFIDGTCQNLNIERVDWPACLACMHRAAGDIGIAQNLMVSNRDCWMQIIAMDCRTRETTYHGACTENLAMPPKLSDNDMNLALLKLKQELLSVSRA